MKKNYSSMMMLAALLAAGAAMTACSNETLVEEQPAAAKTYHLTIDGAKGSALTRALSGGNGLALESAWSTSDQIIVTNSSADVFTGYLSPDANAASAKLSGSLSGYEINTGDYLSLYWPAVDRYYTGQNGTLAKIATNYDYIYGQAKVTSGDASSFTAVDGSGSGPVKFSNQQAIMLFKLLDEYGNPLSVNYLTIEGKSGSEHCLFQSVVGVAETEGPIGISLAPSSDKVWVALSTRTNNLTFTLTASNGTSIYRCEKTGVTIKSGEYYEVTATMKEVVLPTDVNVASNYTATDGEVLTGTLTSELKISIADGATVTLHDVVINGGGFSWDSEPWAGITCEGDATIILSGTNIVKGFYEDHPGIHVPSGKTLTILGDGSLNASSNGYGAGIGGGYEIDCGNIVIAGGKIIATGGGTSGAGIGGGYGACGNITIMGGTINATGGGNSAGIGSSAYGSCGDITIYNTVTSVTATKDGGAPNSIGQGQGGSCGTVTIGGTVGAITTSPYTYAP